MYVPSYDSLLRAIGISRVELDNSDRVTVPVALFKLLLQMANASSEFNEKRYLAENPDIMVAVNSGTVESPKMHYLGFGYFEGRLGATPDVDEEWYLEKYPDVADAARAGNVKSAAEHFSVIGAGEGRSPSARYEAVALEWKRALVENSAPANPPRRVTTRGSSASK
jgi:hypothetical protein